MRLKDCTNAALVLREVRRHVVELAAWESESKERSASEFRTDVLDTIDTLLFAEESPNAD